MKQNCWEFMKCSAGKNHGLGICPAKTEIKAHNLNNGRNGGRICWAVAGTLCYGKVQGTYAEKVLICSDCDFRRTVQEEEWPKFRVHYLKS